MVLPLRRMTRLFLLLALTIAPAAARAEVEVAFWSHPRDRDYEHTFLIMRGTVDATHERIDSNVGFTAAERASPMLLVRSANGRLQRVSRGYVGRSRAHFTLRLDDARFLALRAYIARWRAAPQPSYNLHRRNCVHFVMGAAEVLGLRINRDTAYVLDPAAFLDELARLNPRVMPLR